MKKLFLEENEDVVLENITRNFKNELKVHPSSEKEVITEEQEVLEEGLKFFKVSGRLFKLADKIARKARQKDKPELIDTVKKINELANKFENAEDLYEIGRKKEAKIKYKALTKNYAELLKMLKKQDVIDALKSVGGVAMTIATMTVPYLLLNKFFPKLSFGATQTAAAAEPGFLNQAKIFLKRAGAMTLCGIPTKAARGIFNNGISVYDDKIIKQVDNLLA